MAVESTGPTVETSTTPDPSTDEGTPGAQWARAVWSAAEPFTLGVYFTPEAAAVVEAVGLPGRSAFVALRSAPLGGAVPAVVAAAFRGFPAATITPLVQAARRVLAPEAAAGAMHEAVTAFAHRVLPDLAGDPRVQEVAGALEQVVAQLDTTGRPLAAGGQAITAAGSTTAPTDPWARLWRAANTLREYRGDAHVAALTAAALPRVEADVLTAAWAGAQIDVAGLRATRGLDDATWDTATTALRTKGLLDGDGTITATGQALRDDIETATDTASATPWVLLGEDGTRAAWDLLAQASTAVVEAGAMRGTTPVGGPWPPVPVAA